MNYDPQEIFRTAASLAAGGMKIVKLFGVRDDGSCTCREGARCESAGKHPAMGAAWHTKATDDEEEIAHWFLDITPNQRWNIGVRLGRVSGIIDVEADDEAAIETMKRFGLDRIDTVAYKGSRGPHYLFQFDAQLPDVAVVHIDSLEVRIGGGAMAAQSVFPKSWHRTGAQYDWLPGRSPDDTIVAPLPAAFKEAILTNSRARGGGVIAQARDALAQRRIITAGGRHAYLLGQASKLAGRIRDYTDGERAELLNTMLALNAQYCRPPKEEQEVVDIVEAQFAHYATRNAEVRGRRPLERFGLRWNHELREYEIGEWHCTVIQSDPIAYRLRIPHVAPREGHFFVMLSVEQWTSARKVAEAILHQQPFVNVMDPNPAKWVSTWIGETVNEDGERRVIRGLQSKLTQFADEEMQPSETKHYAYLAAVLLAYLRQFDAVDDSDDPEAGLPNLSGTPKRIKREGREELWFQWKQTWSQATKKLPKGELTYHDSMTLRRKILDYTGQKAFVDSLKTVNGERARWIVWGDKEIKAIETLACH